MMMMECEMPRKLLRTEREEKAFQTKWQCSPHFGFLDGHCINCGQPQEEEEDDDDDDDTTFVPFAYLHDTLKLSQKAIDEYRRMKLRNLTRDKKLVLVLDLDHTLLHTTDLDRLSDKEEYLLTSPLADGLHTLDSMGFMITKLRPFVHTFLEEASKLFELYVYTMGDRPYARKIAEILDPGRKLFGSRVISRQDCTRQGQKGLDVVLADEQLVVILDDTERVWSRHPRNLIRMQSYDFFASGCHSYAFGDESFSEVRMDERGPGGLLDNILDVLRRVHSMVFDPKLGVDLSSTDVPHVLEKIRREVLGGCTIVFPVKFFSDYVDELNPTWQMAEQLGATCSVEVDDSVTHVVSTSGRTSNARWAVQHEKRLVTPDWVEAAYYMWKRPAEDDFAVATPSPPCPPVPVAPSRASAVSPPLLQENSV